MAIITRRIMTFVRNTDGSPALGLAPLPTIDILDSGGTLVVTASAMTELGSGASRRGFYFFDFTTYDTTENYGIRVDAGVAFPNFARYIPAMNEAEDAEEIVDQNWEEVRADHLTPGTTGEAQARQGFDGFVWVDPVGGTAGTTYPTGTRAQPASVMADAFTIATTFDLNAFKILNDTTVPSGRADAFFEGIDADVELDLNGQNLDGSVIHGLSLVGSAAGADLFIFDCILQSVTNFVGRATRCRLEGTITIANNETEFLQCFSSEPGPLLTPIVNMAGPTAVFGFRAYSGGIEIGGMAAVGNIGSIDMIAGQIILAATDSAGVITLRGVGNLTDSSTGTTVEKNAFLNLSDIQTPLIVEHDATQAQITALSANVNQLRGGMKIEVIPEGDSGISVSVGTTTGITVEVGS